MNVITAPTTGVQKLTYVQVLRGIVLGMVTKRITSFQFNRPAAHYAAYVVTSYFTKEQPEGFTVPSPLFLDAIYGLSPIWRETLTDGYLTGIFHLTRDEEGWLHFIAADMVLDDAWEQAQHTFLLPGSRSLWEDVTRRYLEACVSHYYPISG